MKYLNETTTTTSQCVRFRLLNLRDQYAFALLRGGPQAPVRRTGTDGSCWINRDFFAVHHLETDGLCSDQWSSETA